MTKNIKNTERRPRGKVCGRVHKRLSPIAFRAIMRAIGLATSSRGRINRTGHFGRHKAIKRARLSARYKKLESMMGKEPAGAHVWQKKHYR